MRFLVDEMPKTTEECMFVDKRLTPHMSANGERKIITLDQCSDGQPCDITTSGCHRLKVFDKE